LLEEDGRIRDTNLAIEPLQKVVGCVPKESQLA
jgi:hypothetical protein